MTSSPMFERYQRAEQWLPWHLRQRSYSAQVDAQWLPEHSTFWYCADRPGDRQFLAFDVPSASSKPAFDRQRLAKALGAETGDTYDAADLPFRTFTLQDEGQRLKFSVDQQAYTCDLEAYTCRPVIAGDEPQGSSISPSERYLIYHQDHNLQLLDRQTGQRRPLTTDGVPYHDYGTTPEASTTAVTTRLQPRPPAPVGSWSPDSTYFLTAKIDQREVAEMHLVQSVTPGGTHRPRLHSYRYAMPGDDTIPYAELHLFNLSSGEEMTLELPPIPSISSSPVNPEPGLAWWSEDSSRLYFILLSRGVHDATLYEINPSTGEARAILSEHSDTYVDLHPAPGGKPLARVINDGSEVIWFSERDGWGHLYLYDAGTGEVIRQLTSGDWLVRDIIHVDEDNRLLYFAASGREPGLDPYYRQVYRTSLDEPGVQLLTPEPADHQAQFLAGSGRFLDTYSTVDTAPVTVLRDEEGKVTSTVEEASLGQVIEAGWTQPQRFEVKARDGQTSIYGTLFFPAGFDESERYPVVDYIYPGPQTTQAPAHFPSGDRDWRVFCQAQALAELGFVVVTIDGFGTPYRSKAFHDFAYGESFGDAGGLEDHVQGIKQLGDARPYLDLDRVGIFGHSGGGFASAKALLKYPDFYRVAFSSAGNHDQRTYQSWWGEKYVGILDDTNYRYQANPPLASRLEGKLMLAYGDMDDNVHPAGVLQLVDALVKANKDFDMLVLPNRNHKYTHEPYFIRRRWDYFVRHLLGEAPASDFRLSEPPAEEREGALPWQDWPVAWQGDYPTDQD